MPFATNVIAILDDEREMRNVPVGCSRAEASVFKEDERAKELPAALDSKSLVASYWSPTHPLDVD